MATVQRWSAKHAAVAMVATHSVIAAHWRKDGSAAALGPGLAVIVVGAFGRQHVIPRAGADPLPAGGRAVRR